MQGTLQLIKNFTTDFSASSYLPAARQQRIVPGRQHVSVLRHGLELDPHLRGDPVGTEVEVAEAAVPLVAEGHVLPGPVELDAVPDLSDDHGRGVVEGDGVVWVGDDVAALGLQGE